MKPDWQNKSYAKNGAATGPSTTHPKLKVGMSSLHSKIAVANHNTVQAKKPAVRKFADGGTVLKTRSDDEIGDTNPRTGKVDPGSYDRRMAQGEKNLQMLKDAFNKFTGEKSATTSAATAEAKQPVDRFAGGMSPEAPAKQTKTETATEPSYMADVRNAMTKPKAEVTPTMTDEAPVVAVSPKVTKAPKAPAKPVEMPQEGRSGRKAEPARPPRGQTGPMAGKRKLDAAGPSASGKLIEERMAKLKENAGRKAAEEFNKLYRSR